ncbi:hypothetical protein, partial [Streptomyces erythrochromogenes]
DLLDEWLVHYHHRPHEGLRHPMMPKKALTPNQMWAALVAVAGYVPVPLTGRDYLEPESEQSRHQPPKAHHRLVTDSEQSRHRPRTALL